MRFRHPDGTTVHLSYCSNVHPAEDVDGILAQLPKFAGPVRRAVGSSRLGLGLWLPARAAHDLADDPAAVKRLRAALDAEGLEVVTLNGFPYGGFHDPVVKKKVYRPDWTEPDRLAYTRNLAHVLAELLPDDVTTGSISTLPLGWRHRMIDSDDGAISSLKGLRGRWPEASIHAALDALGRLTDELETLRARTGRTILVGLEPEPGCLVETTSQAADVLNRRRGISSSSGHTNGRTGGSEGIGVCLDACHLAVQFEDPDEAVATLAGAGVPIVKAQISTALRIPEPATPAARAALAGYVEPRFLHQTREPLADGQVAGIDDLDEALGGALPGEREWRVHFHVPVHWSEPGPGGVATTQPDLWRTIGVLVGGPQPLTTHLDVETYTWTVLPPSQRPDGEAGLVDGLARELLWTRFRLTELGLKEVP